MGKHTIVTSTLGSQRYCLECGHGGCDLVELDVCTVCLHLIANGEYNDGTDEGDRKAESLGSNWAGWELVPDGAELGFSNRDCEGCGDTSAGDRYRVYAL